MLENADFAGNSIFKRNLKQSSPNLGLHEGSLLAQLADASVFMRDQFRRFVALQKNPTGFVFGQLPGILYTTLGCVKGVRGLAAFDPDSVFHTEHFVQHDYSLVSVEKPNNDTGLTVWVVVVGGKVGLGKPEPNSDSGWGSIVNRDGGPVAGRQAEPGRNGGDGRVQALPDGFVPHAEQEQNESADQAQNHDRRESEFHLEPRNRFSLSDWAQKRPSDSENH